MNHREIICLNRIYTSASRAGIPVLDGGVLYGQGLFETFLIKDGQPVFADAHLKRLAASAGELSFNTLFTINEVDLMLRETVRLNGLDHGAARITLTSGVEGQPANLFINMRPLPYRPEHYERGFTAGFVPVPRNQRSPLVFHKTTSFFENMLARRETVKKGWDEGLFLNTIGELAEGTVSNIFLIIDGTVVTPSRESGLLPGIMRQVVLDACVEKGIPSQERKVLPGEFNCCQEAFITNSLMGVMPLVSIEGNIVGTGAEGEITQLLRTLISGLH